jgi:hypothetical protein
LSTTGPNAIHIIFLNFCIISFDAASFFVPWCHVKKCQYIDIICRYIVIEVNPTNMKHDAALILKPTSLYFAITKIVQQLHGDFGVAATKSGLAGMFIVVNRPRL